MILNMKACRCDNSKAQASVEYILLVALLGGLFLGLMSQTGSVTDFIESKKIVFRDALAGSKGTSTFNIHSSAFSIKPLHEKSFPGGGSGAVGEGGGESGNVAGGAGGGRGGRGGRGGGGKGTGPGGKSADGLDSNGQAGGEGANGSSTAEDESSRSQSKKSSSSSSSEDEDQISGTGKGRGKRGAQSDKSGEKGVEPTSSKKYSKIDKLMDDIDEEKDKKAGGGDLSGLLKIIIIILAIIIFIYIFIKSRKKN